MLERINFSINLKTITIMKAKRFIVVRVKTAWKASELQAQGSALGTRGWVNSP